MAANNYYGLPQVVHGQPTVGQYTAAATAYPAPAPGTAVPVGYSAAAAASAATSYAAARPAAPSVLPAAYSAYPQTAPTYAASAAPATSIVATPAYSYQAQYAAASGLPTAASGAPAVAAAYYPQASVAAGVTYTAGDSTNYQARPTYSHAHAQVAAMAARQPIVTATTRPVTSYVPAPAYTSAYSSSAAYTPTTSYSYQHTTMPTTSYPPPILTYPQPGQLPSAVTAAAKPNIYVQPQPAATINIVPAAGAPKVGQWRAVKPAGPPGVQQGARVFKGPRIPPKPQQLHYCEVCKISCAGPQTYKEHLEGQKHKKKEASVKTGTSGPTTRGGNALRCELCDVTCTGSDAYAAHIRGAKHQKVVKLHTKLGKPIPSVDPVLVTKGAGSPASSGGPTSAPNAPAQTTTTTPTGPPPPLPNPPQSIANLAKPAQTYTSARQPTIPKITFVGSDKIKPEVTKVEVKQTVVAKPYNNTYAEQEVTIPRLPEEKDVQPVGHDYIEEIKNEEGKVISFSCKLCECRFNDPNAKEMHMKGRRHRLQYKKKVNPDLVVDIKPSLRQRKMQEERAKRSQAREEFWKRREEEFRLMEEEERVYWAERRRFEEETDDVNWYRRFPGRGGPGAPHPSGPPGTSGRFGPGGPHGAFGPHFMMRRPDTVDDRHCVAKHEEIYPGEEELEAITRIVVQTETALKKVSDYLAAQDVGIDKKPKVIKEEAEKGEDNKTDSQRILVGVMRVGLLAKQLLLKGDTAVALVVLCREKPTKSLLERIASNLPMQLAEVAGDCDYKFEVKRVIEEANLVVTGGGLTVTITLTSPLMRESAEEQGSADPPDVLDHDKCIAALAELRHVKWFHSRALSRHSCTVVIRILRDLCLRNPTWSPLNCWAIELLVEKVLNSAGVPLSPGDALRRVFEALAGGILLPDSPGFLDPCEKEPMDAAQGLTNQEREDVTSSSQHALRLIAFRQVHKVLGMEQLPPPKQWRFARKRRRDSSSGEVLEGEAAEEKKDKKEEGEAEVV